MKYVINVFFGIRFVVLNLIFLLFNIWFKIREKKIGSSFRFLNKIIIVVYVDYE